MPPRLALPLLVAALLPAADASAQISVDPGGPLPPNVCGIRLISYGPTASTGSGTGCLRFDAATGDRARLRVTGGQVALRRPDGTPGCAGTIVTCTLPMDGRYSATVTATGPYTLSLQRLNNPVGCTTPTIGNPRTISTIGAAETRCYRVEGEPGMRLRVRVVGLSAGIDPVTEVLRPNGTTRCAGTVANDVTCELDITGRHTVLVRDSAATAGNFAIQWQRLDAPRSCRTITFGPVPVTDSVSDGSFDCFRFDLATGDKVHTRVHPEGQSPTLRAVHEILRPDGTTLCGAVIAEDRTCWADATGTHTMLVSDVAAATGAYYLSLQRLNNPVGCTPGWLGPEGTRAELGFAETHCLRIFGTAGDRLGLRVVPGQGHPMEFDVISPDGIIRCWSEPDCVLDATGNHTILIRDTSWAAFGTYWWSVQRLNRPDGCTTLTRDAPPVTGGVGVGDSPCWRFSGAEGERIRIKLNKLSGDFDLELNPREPDGTSAGTASTTGSGLDITEWLSHTGTYTLYVRDITGTYTGSYDIAIND